MGSTSRFRPNTDSGTYPDDLCNVISLINHRLQRVLFPFPRPFPLVDDPLEDHIQRRASISSLELCRRREPRKDDSGRRCTLLYPFKEVERFRQQARVAGNFVATHRPHGQLEDDPIDAVKRIGNSAGRRRDAFQPSIGICNELR
jgi:hypothetical protein